jgi:signal transduction histidine kinase
LRVEFVSLASFSGGVLRTLLATQGAPQRDLLLGCMESAADRHRLSPGTHCAYLAELGGTALFAVLNGDEEKTFVMCVGPKRTQEPYGRDETAMLHAVSGQLATIVDKLALVEELGEKSRELQDLNRLLVEAHEEERARIAAHIHDDPLQKLTYVLWQCQDRLMPDEVVRVLQDVVNDLRNFSSLLRPSELEDLGLARALEALVTEIETRSAFETDLEVKGLSRDERLPHDMELGIYRIIQEALTNCQKHAHAANVWVKVSKRGKTVTLTIEDDGQGLSPPAKDGRRHLGVAGMRQRAEQIGGQFLIAPRKPRGTSVRATIPLGANAAIPVNGHQAGVQP